MSLYLNTYALAGATTVWNVNNTSDDPKVRRLQFNKNAGYATIGWYDLWKAATAKNASPCAVNDCTNEASVGAHISFPSAKSDIPNGSNRVFICPMCSNCNNARGYQVTIKRGTPLIHLGLFQQDILPDENVLTEIYENSSYINTHMTLKDYISRQTENYIRNQLDTSRAQTKPNPKDRAYLLGPLEDASENLSVYVSSLIER